MRALLTNPVREYRTPGSARGPSGNRLCYLNGIKMIIRDTYPADSEWITSLVRERWNGPFIISKGKKHDARSLPGIIASEEDRQIGLLLYAEGSAEIEIVTVDTLVGRRGVGRRLLESISNLASRRGIKRLWLITTNDNAPAIAFYTACGFRLIAVHLDGVTRARELKPEIPLVGHGGVRIRDELEFEKVLPNPGEGGNGYSRNVGCGATSCRLLTSLWR